LDDPNQPIAETCRRVGARAESLGLPRPSYVHLRRYIVDDRARRGTIRQILADTHLDVMRSRVVDGYDLVERIGEARS
jgi:hypothetical protein